MLNILTRCTRPNYLLQIKSAIDTNKGDSSIRWHIIFDTSVIKDLDAEMLFNLQNEWTELHFMSGFDGDYGHGLLNSVIDKVSDGWVWILDDDNQVHPDFFRVISEHLSDDKSIVFNQRIDGKDFTGQEIRYARPENMKVGGVDSAQYVLSRKLIDDHRLVAGAYVADSIFIEQVYNSNPSEFIFLDVELCYYNYFSKPGKARVPKILLHTDDSLELKSSKKMWFESEELVTECVDQITNEVVIQKDPDFIISLGKDSDISSTLSRKYFKADSYFERLGDLGYHSAMFNILDRKTGMVSFFTPIYNTGDRLTRLFDSIKAQSNPNWEWIIVNDSSDHGKTLKLAEKIAASDHRVKVYDFRKKSGGIIGETKYRAAMLCEGDILAEIDHDDYILPDSVDLLQSAFAKYPDAGFAYTDCVEILEDWKTTLMYPDGFCFGYGKYRQEECMGIQMNINVSPNINPKTIRHIVGVPNHIRAWRRETYLKLGGHNRRLSIADDYELVVRTFLATKFIRIRKNCYLQFIYNTPGSSNTHQLARADIQRRVRTIQEYYNFSIWKRFAELGVEDWAYLFNQANPLVAPSRHEDEEGAVNYDFEG